MMRCRPHLYINSRPHLPIITHLYGFLLCFELLQEGVQPLRMLRFPQAKAVYCLNESVHGLMAITLHALIVDKL